MKRIKTLLVMCGMVVVLAGLLVLVRNLAGEKEGSDTSDTGSADTTYTAAQVDIDSLYLIEYNI